MTQAGFSGKALRTATVASIFGDYFGEFILILVPFILRASQKPLDRPNIFQFM